MYSILFILSNSTSNIVDGNTPYYAAGSLILVAFFSIVLILIFKKYKSNAVTQITIQQITTQIQQFQTENIQEELEQTPQFMFIAKTLYDMPL